jgi:hypothetical protein
MGMYVKLEGRAPRTYAWKDHYREKIPGRTSTGGIKVEGRIQRRFTWKDESKGIMYTWKYGYGRS